MSQNLMTSAELKKFQEEKRKEQELFRNDPAKLAAAIAEQIRLDNHANENPRTYENGAMHWWQESWGMASVNVNTIEKLDASIFQRSYHNDDGSDSATKLTTDHDWFEITCATSGCIAGWATSLAGFPFTFKQSVSGYSAKDSIVERVVEYLGEDELLSVDLCYDPIQKDIRNVSEAARELLHLSFDQRDWLFNGDRIEDEVLWALDLMSNNQSWVPGDCPFESDSDNEDYDDEDDEEYNEDYYDVEEDA